MKQRILGVTLLLTASFLGGCSSVDRIVRQQGAGRVEANLAAAGFHIEPADTADRLAGLHDMTPFEVIAQRNGAEQVYTYADPLKCRCAYVGDARQYAEYQRLRREESTVAAEQQALRIDEALGVDLGWRAPWSNPWWW
jgi:hypothetical protein